MNVSELIKLLQHVRGTEGDIPVTLYQWDTPNKLWAVSAVVTEAVVALEPERTFNRGAHEGLPGSERVIILIDRG